MSRVPGALTRNTAVEPPLPETWSSADRPFSANVWLAFGPVTVVSVRAPLGSNIHATLPFGTVIPLAFELLLYAISSNWDVPLLTLTTCPLPLVAYVYCRVNWPSLLVTDAS